MQYTICYVHHSFKGLSLFPRLQSEQATCKFSILCSFTLDHGIIWSICNSTSGAFLPQYWQVKLSLFRTLNLILEGILLESMYAIPSTPDVAKIVVDESVVRGDSEPLLVYETPSAAAAGAEE